MMIKTQGNPSTSLLLHPDVPCDLFLLGDVGRDHLADIQSGRKTRCESLLTYFPHFASAISSNLVFASTTDIVGGVGHVQ